MSLDRAGLAAAIAAHGPVWRVVVARVEGSAPREVGAAMLVWDGGQAGTIGGGALEFAAAAAAREGRAARVARHPLGPALGQCCGGAVTLVTERWTDADLPEGPVAARGLGEMPLAVRRLLAAARGEGRLPAPQLIGDWMVEPVTAPSRPVWIWGAGHVGRALIGVLHPLPHLALTWIDTAPERFPDPVPEGVAPLVAADPGRVVGRAPAAAEHLIVTYSHALDLDLCHRLLSHGFATCGLIGSATKWARFRGRLRALGHSDAQIARIRCPIGQPELGKHPQAIAIGVASAILAPGTSVAQRGTG
ncbi:xanthine dehydrogenase accessory protein XdhC [Rhodobacteraceae bacterium CCMM004]|nr:xanthine dehydrogenase accessory protein XdhC [Rhodobacteraceae bacterium CCMM004]